MFWTNYFNREYFWVEYQHFVTKIFRTMFWSQHKLIMAGCKVSARIINAHAKLWFLHPCTLMSHWMTNILQTQQKETRLITSYMTLTFKIFVTVQESPVRWHVSILKGNNALNLHPCHLVKSVSLSLEWALGPGQGSCLLACFDQEQAAIWESWE